MDALLSRMESYAQNLESIGTENTVHGDIELELIYKFLFEEKLFEISAGFRTRFGQEHYLHAKTINVMLKISDPFYQNKITFENKKDILLEDHFKVEQRTTFS